MKGRQSHLVGMDARLASASALQVRGRVHARALQSHKTLPLSSSLTTDSTSIFSKCHNANINEQSIKTADISASIFSRVLWLRLCILRRDQTPSQVTPILAKLATESSSSRTIFIILLRFGVAGHPLLTLPY